MSSATTNTMPKDIREFVVNQGHGAKGLVDMGIDTLPKEYIKPLEERFNTYKIAHNSSIPVIDMSNLDDPNVQQQICNAAQKWGFFQIINHGVPLEVQESIKAATYRFFESPVEEKSKYLVNKSPTVNLKYSTSFRPQHEKILEWKDFISMCFVSDDETLTQWPTACRNEALNYLKSTEIVTRNLIKILMKGLNIDEIDEEKERLLMGSKRMNLTYYPKCPNPELTFGNNNHSDASTLTILLQDDVGGLYVRHYDNESWVHVPSIDGALVINIGDVLQILSNGKYRSVEHLVTVNKHKNRISVPIFVHSNVDNMIAPFQDIIDRGEKPMYKSVLFSDYLKHFFSMPHDGKAAALQFATISS